MKNFIFLIFISLLLFGCNNEIKKPENDLTNKNKDDINYGFKGEVCENCLWCGRHIDLKTCGVVVFCNNFSKDSLYNELNYRFIDSSMVKQIPRFDISTQPKLLTKEKFYVTSGLLCSFKCFNEFKDLYYTNFKFETIVTFWRNNLTDYYFYIESKK